MLEVMVLATLVPRIHSAYDSTYANVMRRHGHGALIDKLASMRHHRRLSSSACSLSDDDTSAGQYLSMSCANVSASGMCSRDTLPLCPVSCGACPSYTYTNKGVTELLALQLAGAGMPLGEISAGDEVTDAHQALLPKSIEESVALGFAVKAITADLSGFCDCFTEGWSSNAFTPLHCWMNAATLLPIAGPSCGAPWYRDTNILPNDVGEWPPEGTLSFALMGGEMMSLDKDRFYNNWLNNHPIDGKTFAVLSFSDLLNMGFNVGEAHTAHGIISEYFFGYYHSPPNDTYATWDPPGPYWDLSDGPEGGPLRSLVEANPIEIATSIVLEALIGIDEVNFCFEIQFLLVMAWQDERIDRKCTGAGSYGQEIPSSDRCAHYWRPTMPPVFANQVSIDGNAPIEVIEDLGFFTIPGRFIPGLCTPEQPCESPVNTSTAFRMMRLRGSFGAAMEFRRFPYDKQELEVIVRAPANLPRQEYVFVPKATVDPAVMEQQAKSAANDPNNPGKDVIAGWRVERMSASERPLIANTTFWDPTLYRDGASASNDPLFSLMNAVTELGPAAVADATIPYYSVELSEAVFVVYVCRIPSSYVYNFMILITMLEMIAFVSYLLSPSELESRVNLSLTVFLGVIFFQIMLSELLPTTGYLTDMHWFTFFSTVLVVLIAASHVCIFGIQSKAVQKGELLRRMARLRKSRRVPPAVAILQRQVRIHLARKSIQERKQLLAKQQRTQDDSRAAAPAGTAIWVGAQVSPLTVGQPQGEAQAQSGTEHKVLSLLETYRAQSKNTTLKGKALRILKEVNDVFELFCVNCLIWINWIVAIAFVATYFVILTTIFKGADEARNCL